ncbi:unnamed protein product [Linum tenue]|uniref:Uncharacterized protein n=1 Tax=Linum tenue TaxID=586396 RepID=A0AAV0J0J9_9ROSI|nr:unnamed protein product [Linum tenue]
MKNLDSALKSAQITDVPSARRSASRRSGNRFPRRRVNSPTNRSRTSLRWWNSSPRTVTRSWPTCTLTLPTRATRRTSIGNTRWGRGWSTEIWSTWVCSTRWWTRCTLRRRR